MMDIFFELFWLFLPAGVANMMPPIAAKVFPSFDRSVDNGAQFRGRPLFGSHKTWRGIIAAVIGGGIVFLIQRELFPSFGMIDLRALPWWLGAVVGLGAIGGDLVESFLKRQIGVVSGASWFPFDQIDWYIGSSMVISFFMPLSFLFLMTGLFLAIAFSVMVKGMGYLLGIDEKPF